MSLVSPSLITGCFGVAVPYFRSHGSIIHPTTCSIPLAPPCNAPGWLQPGLFLRISVWLLSPGCLTPLPTLGSWSPSLQARPQPSDMHGMEQTPVLTVLLALAASFQDINPCFLRLFSHRADEIKQ